MNRCFGWIALVFASILLAVATGTHQTTVADPNTPASASANNGNILAELKEIRKQLKEINDHLHTGVTKVMIPMNPYKKD
jgi:hypothetical protein